MEGTHDAVCLDAVTQLVRKTENMISGTIIVVDVERTKLAEAHVRERLEKGQCIACVSDPKPHRKRGLCDTCHSKFLRCLHKLGDEEKGAKYKAKLQRKGLLLREDEIRQFNTSNPFADVADEVRNSK